MAWRTLAALGLAALLAGAGCGDGGSTDGDGGNAGGAGTGGTDGGTGGTGGSGGEAGTGGTGGTGGEAGSGGTGGEAGSGGTGGTGGASSNWTVMVYMAADNELEPRAIEDLREMMEVGSRDGLNLVVEIDRAAGHSEARIGELPSFTGTKRLLVKEGSVEELDDLGERNMGQSATLSTFVGWGVETYPAEHYALILWGPGGGWSGFGGDLASPGDLLDLNELEAALAGGLDSVGVDRLDLIAFDAPLMASYEVAANVRAHADLMLASEELRPGHGLDYGALSVLVGDAAATGEDLGTALLEGFAQQAAEEGTSNSVTLSLVDLGKLDRVEAALGSIDTAFATDPDGLALVFAAQRRGAETFGATGNAELDANAVDLGDFVARIDDATAAFSSGASAMRTALDAAVILNHTGRVHARAKGLSVYFPMQEIVYRSDYDSLDRVGPWRRILLAYFRVAQEQTGVPAFTNPDGVADVSWNDPWLVFSGDLDPSTTPYVSFVQLDYGLYSPDDGSLVLYGTDDDGYVDGDTVVAGWTMKILQIDDGIGSGGLYLMREFGTDYVRLTVPFGYYATPTSTQAELVILVAVFDLDGNYLEGGWYNFPSGGGATSFEPLDGSAIVPLAQLWDDTTTSWEWALTTDYEFDPLGDWTTSYVPVPTGASYFGILTATNLAGDGDSVSYIGTR